MTDIGEEELLRMKESGDAIVKKIKEGTATIDDVYTFFDILLRLKSIADYNQSPDEMARVMFLIGYTQCYLDFKERELNQN